MKDSQRDLSACGGDTESPAKHLEYFISVLVMASMASYIFDEHILPCVEFANGLSRARHVDLLDAGLLWQVIHLPGKRHFE